MVLIKRKDGAGINKKVPLAKYAEKNNKNIRTCQTMAEKGGFKTAVKPNGHHWFIDPDEPYPDRRVKTGRYKDWRKFSAEKKPDGD